MEKRELTRLELVLKSPDELPVAAEQLIRFCGDIRVVAFYGEMGAGKTTFIRSVCRALGVAENISSPTFSLINEYLAGNGVQVYHFDFYRLNKPEDALQLGLEEYFYSGCWCFIEWSEKILNLLPEQRVEVRIHPEGSTRTITFSYV